MGSQLYWVDPTNGEVLDATTRLNTATVSYRGFNDVTNSAKGTSISSVILSTAVLTSSTDALSTTRSSTSTSTPSIERLPHSHLSAGAGAGIGIGCAIAVAGATISIWLWRRERRKRKRGSLQGQARFEQTLPTTPPMYQPEPDPKRVHAHVHPYESAPELPPQELEHTPRSEAP